MIAATRDERGIARYAESVPRDLAAMLDHTVARYPDKLAYVDPDSALTWTQVGEEVAGLAGRLVSAGVRPGDRVALLAGNSAAFAVAAFAVWRASAVFVPLNHRLTARDLAALLQDSQAALVLTDATHADLGKQAAEDVHTRLEVAGSDGRFLGKVPVASIPPETPGPDAFAAIMYTSGTTGAPKGVVITHGNALQNSVTCTSVIGRSSTDRELIMVPQFNVTGLCSQTIPAAHLGMTSVLFGPFDAERALRAAQEHRATSTVGAPTMWWRLLEAAERTRSDALKGFRLALFGGAPMPTSLLSRMRATMPAATFGNGYGQTETCSMVAYAGGQEALLRPDTVGRPLPITDAKIIDPETGSPAAAGQAGELVVRGAQISAGYWRDGVIRPIADAEGWVHTGDAAIIDNGFVVLRDRLKDVIKRGGESVFSFEVEDAIAQHPDVLEVAVVGLPDEHWGEVVAAAVVAKNPVALDENVLRTHCANELAKFKIPRHFVLRNELPRNAGGKVLKSELRTQLQEHLHHTPNTPTKE